MDYSWYYIPQARENNKQYTACDVYRADHARQFQHISGQPVKWILHALDNNILQNIPIFREDVGMYEDIYGPSVPYLQGKTVLQKNQNV